MRDVQRAGSIGRDLVADLDGVRAGREHVIDRDAQALERSVEVPCEVREERNERHRADRTHDRGAATRSVGEHGDALGRERVEAEARDDLLEVRGVDDVSALHHADADELAAEGIEEIRVAHVLDDRGHVFVREDEIPRAPGGESGAIGRQVGSGEAACARFADADGERRCMPVRAARWDRRRGAARCLRVDRARVIRGRVERRARALNAAQRERGREGEKRASAHANRIDEARLAWQLDHRDASIARSAAAVSSGATRQIDAPVCSSNPASPPVRGSTSIAKNVPRVASAGSRTMTL